MADHITYGTIEEISEIILLQEKFEIREKVLNLLDPDFMST
jgi:hypothetical protein